MDTENKIKFDEVLDEFRSRIEQMEYNKDSDELVKPSELFKKSSYNDMLLAVTAKRPMIVAGEVSDILKDIREKMSDEVSKRIEFIFNMLGTDIDLQEENFKKLPMHQRWLMKAWIYASACLEYVAFGASKMYKKVVKWIESVNGGIGMDMFNIPKELPSLDDAYNYINDKFDLEKQFGFMFNC